jgi:hypothetical protein
MRAKTVSEVAGANPKRRFDDRAVALKLLEVLADALQGRFGGDGVGVRES